MNMKGLVMTSKTAIAAPWEVDPARINSRVVLLVEAFRDAIARMRDEHGFTFEELGAAAKFFEYLHDTTGGPLAMFAVPLCSDVFQAGGNGYTISEEVTSPTYVDGSPEIENPGSLPMRPDEQGTPMIASGRVLDGNHRPLAGAELIIYQASNDGIYSGLWDPNAPKYNLRGRQFTDTDGRYRFTTITPVPYSDIPEHIAEEVEKVTSALGRSFYRPAHIHYEIHHADLLKPFRGEVYFSGDPSIPFDIAGPGFAVPSLQAETVLHDEPEDIAAHGFDGPFNTAVFDFVLKTHASPEIAQ